MKRSRLTDRLNARQRRFADHWNGRGTGVAAARAAGYNGSNRVLQAIAYKLLRHPGVRARIAARLGELVDAPTPVAPSKLPDASLVKGRGRGTATERVEILMGLARNKKHAAKDRIAAISLAAELEGERGRSRMEPPRLALPAPHRDEPQVRPHPALALVMSDDDRNGGGA